LDEQRHNDIKIVVSGGRAQNGRKLAEKKQVAKK
jgi:hypothetical protein